MGQSSSAFPFLGLFSVSTSCAAASSALLTPCSWQPAQGRLHTRNAKTLVESVSHDMEKPQNCLPSFFFSALQLRAKF